MVIHGGTDSKDRAKLLEMLENGDLDAVTNCNVLAEASTELLLSIRSMYS